MSVDLHALTDKEKQTLRLIVRGHDAKSTARELDLSVHTINERLRNARRKLDVTSSREAARLLFESESQTHEYLADKGIGGASSTDDLHQAQRKSGPSGQRFRDRRIIAFLIGGLGMISTLTLFLLASSFSGDVHSERTDAQPAPTIAQGNASTAEIVAESKEAALAWLNLVDAQDWQGSFDAAGEAFRAPNTVDAWRQASQQARTPLGDVKQRVMAQYEPVNAPPNGFHIVRFRTDFANREGAIETVTLEREEDGLKVVGYFIN